MRNNKIVVIVGATGAVGVGAAKFFAAQDSYGRVVLVGRSEEKLRGLRDQIPESEEKIEVVGGCDVRHADQVHQALAKVKAIVKDELLDTVVFSVVTPTKFHDVNSVLETTETETLMEGLNSKVGGALNVLKAFVPVMRKNGTIFVTNGGAGTLGIIPIFTETGIVSCTLHSLVHHLSANVRDKHGVLITSVVIAGGVMEDDIPSSKIAGLLFDWSERNFTNPDAWKDEEHIISEKMKFFQIDPK